MVGLPSPNLMQCCIPLLDRLARQAEDEVEVDVLEPGPPRVLVGRTRLGCGMNAPQHTQRWVVQALYAHAESVHPQATQLAQVVTPQHCARVGLDRHLSPSERDQLIR